jgi:hypothetical protein
VTKYLAIDPGETTGYASFNTNGDGIELGSCRDREQVYRMLAKQRPNVIIMEDYIINPNISHGNSKVETVRVIGAIEYYAWLNDAKVILQPNTIKSIGYRWAGISKPKNHAISHEPDAYVHGVFYLQKNGIRKPQQGKAPA